MALDGEERGQITVGASQPVLAEKDLEPGTCECWFEFTDVYGGVTTSATAAYTIE